MLCVCIECVCCKMLHSVICYFRFISFIDFSNFLRPFRISVVLFFNRHNEGIGRYIKQVQTENKRRSASGIDQECLSAQAGSVRISSTACERAFVMKPQSIPGVFLHCS